MSRIIAQTPATIEEIELLLTKSSLVLVTIYRILQKKEKTKITEIYEEMKKYYGTGCLMTIARVVRDLSIHNFITLEKTYKFPFTIWIKLTEKGRKIAEKLLEVEKLLGE